MAERLTARPTAEWVNKRLHRARRKLAVYLNTGAGRLPAAEKPPWRPSGSCNPAFRCDSVPTPISEF
jgi:hypothetical protein